MALYGSQDAWGQYDRVSWKPGGGMLLHHGGDFDYWKNAGWKLDPERDWKTKWSFQQGKVHGGDSLYHANKWGMTGGYAGWSEDRDRYHRKDPTTTDRAAYTTGKTMQGEAKGTTNRGGSLHGVALEQLDWGAYDKDIQYKRWLEDQGKDRFNTLQDIYDAEEWLMGGGTGGGAEPFDPSGLESQIADLRSDIGDFSTHTDIENIRRQLQEQITDITDRGVEVGQVEGLQTQLARLGEQAATGDQNIQNLLDRYQTATTQQLGDIEAGIGDFEQEQWRKFQGIERDYLQKSDYEQSMSQNLRALQDTMQDRWGRDIEQLDIESIRDSISGAQGKLTDLTSDFAGLGADLRSGAQHSESERALLRQQLESDKTLSAAQRETLRQQIGHLEGDVQRQYTDLSDRLSSGLSGLEGTFEGKIGDVRTALGEGLSDLTGQQADLSEDLSGVKTALGDYKSSTQDEFLGLKDRMTRQADITDQAIQDVHQTRERRLDDLSSEWGQNLRDQERAMTQRVDEGQQKINERLSNLVSSMNYRTLGNTALGIKARRSKAYTSGASSRGTGQLGRGARVKTLNIA